jgi:hypothetical protein
VWVLAGVVVCKVPLTRRTTGRGAPADFTNLSVSSRPASRSVRFCRRSKLRSPSSRRSVRGPVTENELAARGRMGAFEQSARSEVFGWLSTGGH